MKPVSLVTAALVGAASLAAPAAAQHHRAAAHPIADQLRALEAQWNREWAQRDVARLAAHYTRDAVLMAPGARMDGIAQIRAGIAQMVADPGLSLTFHADRVDVSASGDLAYTQGHYTMRGTDPHSHQIVTDHGSYVTTYRRQRDGSWKAIDDIASSGAMGGG